MPLVEDYEKYWYRLVEIYELSPETAQYFLDAFHGDYEKASRRLGQTSPPNKPYKSPPIYTPEEIKIEVEKEVARRAAPPREDKLWEKILMGGVTVITFILLLIGFIIFILMNTYL